MSLGLGTILLIAGPASAVTVIDGPVDLGTSASYSVLAGSAVTNTGPSTLDGDLGVSPQTSITGFPPGIVLGASHSADPAAAQAQADTGTAYDVAASLTPTAQGLADLVGYNPVPGVYSGDALTLSGALVLNGTADSVWVFQAASSLITSPGSTVTMTGGATSCNVFWQVGSSATLGVGSTMVGTVMALASISTGTGTTVDGRLLARTGAVTLQTTAFVLPSGCGAAGSVQSSPVITSGPPATAGLDAPYSFTVIASGSPVSTFSIGSGALPPGLTLSSTGTISGSPSAAGTYAFSITADNGTAPAATVAYSLRVVALLAATGLPLSPGLELGGGILLGGIALTVLTGVRRRLSSSGRQD